MSFSATLELPETFALLPPVERDSLLRAGLFEVIYARHGNLNTNDTRRMNRCLNLNNSIT